MTDVRIFSEKLNNTMRYINTIFGLLVSFAVLLACSEEEEEETSIRVVNGSDETFSRIGLYAINRPQLFGTLAPGDTSVYLYLDVPLSSYGPNLLLVVNQDTLTSNCFLADKAPPSSLPPGKYTYEVTTFEGNGTTYYSTRRLNP